MSSSFTQSLLLAAVDAVAERELDLGINAIADTIVRNPYGLVKMNLGVTRAVEGLSALDTSAVRNPYGCVKMNLGATRDLLVIAGSKAS